MYCVVQPHHLGPYFDGTLTPPSLIKSHTVYYVYVYYYLLTVVFYVAVKYLLLECKWMMYIV